MKTRATLLLVIALLLGPGLAHAQYATATSGNSSLTYYRTSNNRPLVLQWTVAGRGDMLIFPAGGSFTFNLHADHLHSGAHVGPNQIHVQGILDIPGVSGLAPGQVLAGIVYTVDGDSPNGDAPRILEKMEVINNSPLDIPLDVIGMGSQPDDSEYAGPPVTNLTYPTFQTMLGATVTYIEGGAIAQSPFGPLTIGRITGFQGFNPPASFQHVTVRAGETMTMLTELTLAVPAPAPAPQAPTAQ